MTVRPAARVAAITHIVETFKDVPEAQIHIRKLKSIIEPIAASARALEGMRANADPTITQAAHDKKIISNAARLAERTKQVESELHRALGAGISEIQSRIDAKVNLKADDKYASEIRATIRQMPMADKLRTLAELAAKNNGSALAAITEAPSILTGVPELHQKQYRDMILNTHATSELAERAALNDAFFATIRVTEVAGELARDLNDATRLMEINKGVDAAAAAEASFNNPTE